MFSWLFSNPLPVGAVAPDFTLPDETGRRVSLAALRGQSVVLATRHFACCWSRAARTAHHPLNRAIWTFGSPDSTVHAVCPIQGWS